MEATGRMRGTGAGWGSGAGSGTQAGGGMASSQAAELRAGRTHTVRWEGVQGSSTVLALGRISKVAR